VTRRPLALLVALALGACIDTSGAPPPLDYGLPHGWPGRSELPPLGGGRIIVTNSLDDTLSLLDLDTLDTPDWSELARVPVGLNPVELEGPHHAAYSPRGDFYYVGLSYSVPGGGSGPHGAHGTGTADGYCLKLDAQDNHLVASARVDRNPGDLVLSADGHTLYVTHFDLLKLQEAAQNGTPHENLDANLVLLDADTMKVKKKVPVCPAPHAVRLSPDETRAYVACISDEVAIVRLDDPGFPVTRVSLPNPGSAQAPRYSPYALTLSPIDGSLWVSSLDSPTVYYLDPTSLRILPERSLSRERLDEELRQGVPMFGALGVDGQTLLMPYQRVDTVAIIDLRGSEPVVKGKIHLSPAGCLNVHQVALTPDGKRALAVCEGDHVGPGTLHVLDLEAGEVRKTVKLGIYPDSVGILRKKP
jgi:DNA-binding beta-propeller fold protein YncE